MLPRCGDGHQIEGWPLDEIPAEIWQVVDVYLMCGEHHLPAAGGVLDQDAWTMDAFLVLGSTDEQIQRAKMRSYRVRQGMDPDG